MSKAGPAVPGTDGRRAKAAGTLTCRPLMSEPFLPKGRTCNNFNRVATAIIPFRSWVCHFALPTYPLLTEHDDAGHAALRNAAPSPSLGVR
jgi:hypothetical protein